MASAPTVEQIAAQWKVSIDPLVGDKAFSENVSTARFANPAAYHVHNTAIAVVPYILDGTGQEAAFTELDDLGRLLALRVTAPSASLKCFFDLRDIVFQETEAFSAEEVARIQERIDACMLRTIDTYVQSREKLGAIANDELKRRNEMLEKLVNADTREVAL